LRHKYPGKKHVIDADALKLLPVKTKKAKAPKDAKLPFVEVLLREFDYVKETASQAMGDRLTLVNYFLLSTGVVLASFGLMVSYEGGAQFAYRYEVLIILSLIFNAVGWIYFLQVVRLRQAWCESAVAMNHLKLVFAQNSEFLPESAEKAFLWNIASIPTAAKKMTVFYFSALLISLLSAAAIGLAAILSLSVELLRTSDQLHEYIDIPLTYPVIGFGLGLYHLLFQMSMYTALLEEPAMPKEEQGEKKDALRTP
jgi:hypothetical protein